MRDLEKCQGRIVNNSWSKYLIDPDDEQKGDHVNVPVNTIGGFLNGDYAWLSTKNRLLVFNTKTCERQSLWTFSMNVSCAVPLAVARGAMPLLLVGLDNSASKMRESVGMLCIFDCSCSRVIRAIRLPAGVEQVCVLHENREEGTNLPMRKILANHNGLVYVVLRNFQHLVVDLMRNDWENAKFDSLCKESNPAEVEIISLHHPYVHNSNKSGKHSACDLMDNTVSDLLGFDRSDYEFQLLPDEKFCTSCETSNKVDCIVAACLGRIVIWQNDGSIKWISYPSEDDCVISHLSFLEPIDDPKPFYYLCAVYQNPKAHALPVIRMFAMHFEQKVCLNDVYQFRNLEGDPVVKFEIEWEDQSEILSLQAIERDSNGDKINGQRKRGEKCLLLMGTENKMLLFDLNQWYKEHMPRSLLECANPKSIAVVYQMRSQKSNSDEFINYYYVPSSLGQFRRYLDNQRGELFYPNSLGFEWMELRMDQFVFWETRGVQAEFVREIVSTGSIILQQPNDAYHRCLSIGLIPFSAEITLEGKTITQRETLLSLCLEQRLLSFLVKCAKEWSDGSASYLFPAFLKWTVQRATSIKQVAERFCISLFDQSRLKVDESELRVIRYCCKQLEWLSVIIAKLPSDSVDLKTQQQAIKRFATYLNVLPSFYHFGLLPEFGEQFYENECFTKNISYPYSKLREYYQARREENGTISLFIDEFIEREIPQVKIQWEQEGEYDSYPPSSLQSLLRILLTEYDGPAKKEMDVKHQIITYLLIDVATFHELNSKAEELIKYPQSVMLNPSKVKLIQAFYLLDHKDYVSFEETIYKFVSVSDLEEWHHRLIIKTLLQHGQHSMAMHYIRVNNPPLSNLEDQKIVIDLMVKHGLVIAAFHYRPPSHYSQLLTCFFDACKTYDKLSEILHLNLNSEEEDAFLSYLEKTNCHDFHLLYNIQRCHYSKNQLAKKDNQSTIMRIATVYHATLPDIVKRFRACADRRDAKTDSVFGDFKPLSHASNRNKARDICDILMEKTQEFNKRINGINSKYIPFVSAPSVSLRPDNKMNTHCVEYPIYRTKKCAVKRKPEESSSLRMKYAKKQKMSVEEEPSKTPEASGDGGLEVSLRTFTSTPLIKRCGTPYAPSFNYRESTPHSILKTRQLITKSAVFSDSVQKKSFIGDESARQIRFRFSSTENSLINNEENNETLKQSAETQPSRKLSLEPRQSSELNVPKRRSELGDRSVDLSMLNTTTYLPSCLPSGSDTDLSVKDETLHSAENSRPEEHYSETDETKTNVSNRLSLAADKTTFLASFLPETSDDNSLLNNYLSEETDHISMVNENAEDNKMNQDIEVVDLGSSVEEIQQDAVKDKHLEVEEIVESKSCKSSSSDIELIVEDVNDELEESFVSVPETMDDVFEAATMAVSEPVMAEESEPVSSQPSGSTEEYNITDDESVHNADVNDREERPSEKQANVVTITDDESNDSLMFSRKKSEKKVAQSKSFSQAVRLRSAERTERSRRSLSRDISVEPIVREVELKPSKMEEVRKTPSRRKPINRTKDEEKLDTTEDEAKTKTVKTRKASSRLRSKEVKSVEEEKTNREPEKETVVKKSTRKTSDRQTKKQLEEKEEKAETEKSVQATTPERSLRRSQRAQSVTADVSESSLNDTKRHTRSRRAQSVALEALPEDNRLDVKTRVSRAKSVSADSPTDAPALRRTRSSSSLVKAKEKTTKSKRLTKISISEVPILEGSIEEQANEAVKQAKLTVGKQKKTTTRKKRTISESSGNEDSSQFKFSLPDTKDTPPINEESIETASFQFSPPHTRSRQPSKRK